MTRYLFFMLAVSSVIAGCADGAGRLSERSDEEGIVRGTVSYRERIALPPDAIVEVWITDVSPLVSAHPVIAETTVSSSGRQVPIAFELRYDPQTIDAEHDYAIHAVIRNAGRTRFETAELLPVLTKGHPTDVALWLVSAADRASPAEPASPEAAKGAEWVIVDHRAPGISAMSETEAAAYHGRIIRLDSDEAVSGQDTCSQPHYTARRVQADSFLATQYRIRPGDLDLDASEAFNLRVTEVSCAGGPWAALGSVILRAARDRAFTVWDGVFFELRSPSKNE